MTDAFGHIGFNFENFELKLLDQRKLPAESEYVVCKNVAEVIRAIVSMSIRGAPAIGVAAAYGCLLALKEAGDTLGWQQRLEGKLNELAAARPTAVNLAWAVNRMKNCRRPDEDWNSLLKSWQKEAVAIHEEDVKICQSIGKAGQSLIKDGDTVLTHCNAGTLATGGYGTALGVIRAAVEAGKKVRVIADETRPLFQGARLTAYELAMDHIPVAVACDNACAMLMAKGAVQLVITGADRIAANGDAANKIGTLGVAIIARHFNVPFYIAAPISTIDPAIPSGAGIPIEQRAGEEVAVINGRRITPAGVECINYAFDVTPAALIDGIITEKGILRAPYGDAIRNCLTASSPFAKA